MKTFATPALSFVLAGVGVLMAWAWYLGYGWVLYLVGAVAIGAFALVTWVAWRALPKDPIAAVRWFERRLFAVAGITAVVGAIAIIVGIQFVVPDPPKGAPDEELQKAIKTVAAAGLSAVIAFITAFGIKADGFDDSVGDSVSSAFAKKYVEVAKSESAQEKDGVISLPADSDGWKAAISAYQHEGWGKAVRRKRAAELDEYIRAEGLGKG
jgi:hypothetical protein